MTALAVTLADVTTNEHQSRPLGPGNHELVCEVCGGVFYAKRSDANTCSGACRQALHRREHDPVRNPTPASTRKDGSWHRSPGERLDRAIHMISSGGADHLEILLRHVNVPGAVSAPDAPLAEWDKQLTETIRLLSKVRQAVRAEQALRRRT